MTQHLRICLVKKLVSDTVVDCLESIQFLNQREIFHFPEEFQSLRNHPAIAGLPEVTKVLRSMKEVNTYRYMKIALPEDQRPLYLDDNGNFKFAGQLLEEGSDRSRITTRGPQNGEIKQNVACTFKDIGCTFEGTRSALDHHLASAAMSHLSLTTALVLDQRSELERQELRIFEQQKEIADQKIEISEQKAEISEQKAESKRQQAEITTQKTKISEQDTRLSSLSLNTSGEILWRISNFADQLEEAKSNKWLYIQSQPFLTSPHGYKLRARLVLNGYGDGKGTHLSIFIQLLPGEFDSLLRWPFAMKVTFTLLDQPENPDEASHITRSFIPDAVENFQRPPKNSSPVSRGYNKFVSHETLGTRHYLKDHTIFIKIQIG